MQFESPLQQGIILKRYKRFLSDIELENGEVITAHTPNTGSMKTCWEPGWKVAVSVSDNPKRKLPYTLEMTHNGDSWIGVNTSRPNKIAMEAIQAGKIPELNSYDEMKAEKKIGKSRIDIFLKNSKTGEECYVEVKNVTLLGDKQKALFPDGVSERGKKHLEELIELKRQGIRAVMLFVVSRMDVKSFGPAFSIDPKYSQTLVEAKNAGVEMLVYQCKLDEEEITIEQSLPLEIDSHD